MFKTVVLPGGQDTYVEVAVHVCNFVFISAMVSLIHMLRLQCMCVQFCCTSLPFGMQIIAFLRVPRFCQYAIYRSDSEEQPTSFE